jgi:hypothetical protein
MLPAALVAQLRSIAGTDGVIDGPAALLVYECDGYTLERATPEVVVLPRSPAMAMLFWAEPTLTFDLDVFVLVPGNAPGTVVSLEPIYRALRTRGCEVVAEHVVIHGTPVQFLGSPNALADEAIATAARQELDGVPFRVMRPEYLAALWLQAGGAKRRERVSLLRQANVIDESRLAELLQRHGVAPS